MFAGMKVGQRLSLGFGAMGLIVVGLAITAIMNLESMKTATDEATRRAWPEAHSIFRIREDLSQISADCRDLLLSKDSAQSRQLREQIRSDLLGNRELMRQFSATAKNVRSEIILENVRYSGTIAISRNSLGCRFQRLTRDLKAVRRSAGALSKPSTIAQLAQGLPKAVPVEPRDPLQAAAVPIRSR